MADHMMTDDEQLENVKAWFSENGAWLAGGVVLGAVLLFGYRYYGGHKDDVALKAAARFTQASQNGSLRAASSMRSRNGWRSSASVNFG